MDQVPDAHILAVRTRVLLVDPHGSAYLPAHADDPVDLAVALDQRADRPHEVRGVPWLSAVEVGDDLPVG
jgi:hypothetical protein